MMVSRKRKEDDAGIQQVQLGDRDGDDEQLAECLELIAADIAKKFDEGYQAKSWLGVLLEGGGKLVKSLWRPIRRGIKRFSTRERMLAEAQKIKKEGEALLVVSEAAADKINAEAEVVRAEAERMRVETTILIDERREKVIRELQDRGIELAGDIVEGILQIAVAKNEFAELPPPEANGKPKRRRRRVSKPQSKVKKLTDDFID